MEKELLSLAETKERLGSFSREMCTVPEDFDVHEDFLKGLSKAQFIQGFSAYRNMIAELYEQAAENPRDFGLSTLDKKTGEEKLYPEFTSRLTYMEKLAQIHHLILKLCQASQLEGDILMVDREGFFQNLTTHPRIKSPEKILDRLMEKGFLLEGYSGKMKTITALKVAHPIPYLITVMKRFTESPYANIGMEFDYAHFNYCLLGLSKEEKVPLESLFVYQTLNPEVQKFLRSFNETMNREGFTYGQGPISGLCWGRSQFAYAKGTTKNKDYVCRLYQRNDTLVVRLFLRNVNAYKAYIEGVPDYIQEAFINDFGKCTYCKDQCQNRKEYRLNGQDYEKCDGMTFEFYRTNKESIEYYINLLKLSSLSIKKEHKERTNPLQ